MSEIERAIETLKKQDFGSLFVRMDDGSAYALDVAVESAIAALKEKLEREKNPLTCDGCNRSVDRDSSIICVGCTRNPFKTDRYEPKGEKA